MKKNLTLLFLSVCFGIMNAQWTKTSVREKSGLENSHVRHYYTLDLNEVRSQLKNAPEMGKGIEGVSVSIPTMGGKIETFKVFSFPVMDKQLAEQYDLGSYVGVGIEDPTKYIRFSTSPIDFQSMIIKDGRYEFISAMNSDKTLYGVHYKTVNPDQPGFVCTTDESPEKRAQMETLYQKNSSFTHNPSNFAKASDKKYRTLRLALSVTGDYTQYHGGTVAGAMSAINNTLTRVNGIYEKDLALHLNMQNFPGIIYTNPNTDPYSNNQNTWNVSLQQVLTNNVGNANYDIGHLFAASGGGGDAGCIGCVCVNPANSNDTAKGSGYTSSPAPIGDYFDIDYVAHEMGHQLGSFHTFSYAIEGTGVNMEPGSGSSIMGYAGITNADVQAHSDSYFHVASIILIQQNLQSKNCDVETPINNNAPVIQPLTSYTIPKGTAFVLTANATDAENDPLTYTWEQYDSATSSTYSVNPNSTTNPIFRSLPPTNSPTRYFPKLSEVLNGNLTSISNWETVSNVARQLKFVVTVRDNHPLADQQQTNSAQQIIQVGSNGPFTILTTSANTSSPSLVEWNVVGTNASPYNVSNVKIDYTLDNGLTWSVLSASTPNDGSESLVFPASLHGQTIKLRISAINNVFYAVKSVLVQTVTPCDGSAVQNVAVSGVSGNSAVISWGPVSNATYVIQYRIQGQSSWTTVNSNTIPATLSGLTANSTYEVQVAAICSSVTGAFSNLKIFKTLVYCDAGTSNATDDHISNVTLSNVSNNSGASSYTNYTTNPSLQINLIKGNQYSLSVSKGWLFGQAYTNAIQVWIDYNANGIFGDIPEEVILNSPSSVTTPIIATFTVPNTAVENIPYRMRVLSFYADPGTYNLIPCLTPSMGQSYGEVEDYSVVVTNGLSTLENIKQEFSVYPNPTTDILNITKVSDKANYKIYNAAGQLVLSGVIKNNRVNVSSLLKGNYIISIEDNEFKSNFKFIKK